MHLEEEVLGPLVLLAQTGQVQMELRAQMVPLVPKDRLVNRGRLVLLGNRG
jgi:hypothetical protein